MWTFANKYMSLYGELINQCNANIKCRGMEIEKEILNAKISVEVKSNVSIFSHPSHRVIPIRFVLAEYCHILSGKDDVETLQSYSRIVKNYSDDGKSLNSAYGKRLKGQLEVIIQRMRNDRYTRQACASLFSREDGLDCNKVNIPCNMILQFIERNGHVDMSVTSRSSDFVTGFSIDSIHWQLLLVMLCNELGVSAQYLHYTIASLHIYKIDWPIVSKWIIDTSMPYAYEIQTSFPLLFAIDNCRKFFKSNMSIIELCELLGIDSYSTFTCLQLDEIFKVYRNVIKR
jgi:thymidylate synthase